MNEPLQSFEHKDSSYERPDRPWVCGHLSDGQPCPVGPDVRGQCQAHHVCVPAPQGDGHQCVRPAAWGGRCEAGPLADGSCSQQVPPCSPVRSLMARRKRLTILSTALALGCLAFLFGGSLSQGEPGSSQPTWSGRLLSPGELTEAHNSFRHDCGTCHTAGNDGIIEWSSAALSGQAGAHESRRCLKCHDDFEDKYALYPHNLSPGRLNAITKRLQDTGRETTGPSELQLAKLLADMPVGHEGGLVCSTCHREHRGRQADLTQMTNLQCQRCHTNSFHSFSDGHPELVDYPAPARSGSSFDHNSHYGQHFAEFTRTMPDGVKPESCLSCHQDDRSGGFSVLKPFAESCGSCHSGQIQSDALPGIAFLNLPVLDLDSENGRKLSQAIGKWPVTGRLLGPDTSLSPFMMVLLSADAGVVRTYRAIQDNRINLRDLSGESVETLLEVERLVLAIRQLWEDVAESGESVLRARLQAVLGEAASDSELADLTAGWSRRTIQDSIGRWLIEEPEPDPKSQDSPRPSEASFPDAASAERLEPAHRPSDRATEQGSQRGWYADRFLRAWMEVAVRLQLRESGRVSGDGGGRRALQWTLLLELSSPFQVRSGRCMKCHTVEQAEGPGSRIVWSSLSSSGSGSRFVKFSHRPHLTLKMTCQSCHPIRRPSVFDLSFAGLETATARVVSDLAGAIRLACWVAVCGQCSEISVPRVILGRGWVTVA